MASFLNLSPDAIIEIAKLASEITGDESLVGKCEDFAQNEDDEQLYATLSVAASKMIENGTVDSEIEIFILVLIDLLHKVKKNEEKVEQLAKMITSSTSSKIALRLKLIVHLLNSIPHTNAQHFKLFVQALTYAQATKQTDHVLKYASNIENMLNEWNASVSDKRSVYLMFYEILKDQREQAFTILRTYLATFTNAKDVDATALTHATNAVVHAIKHDFKFDALVELIPVQQLAKQDAKLFDLLQILFKGSVADFEKFAAENTDLISKHGLDRESLTAKMRLLTIATLCSNATTSSSNSAITYQKLASDLNIDEDQVESFVIDAVGQGVIDARLNQLNKTVTVLKTMHRQFSTGEWKSLAEKIGKWQATVDAMIQTIRSKKEEALKSSQGKK